MPTVHVISPVAGFGNRLDLELISSLLKERGFDVVRFPVTERGKKARATAVARRLFSWKGRFDINLFLAPIFPEWLPLARKNILVPNAEGFAQPRWLPRIDLVLAKTRLTEKIFRGLDCPTEFVSFTSPDQMDESVPRAPQKFFHSCSSMFKGTERLLTTWLKHPEWPELVATINHNERIPVDLAAPNLRLIRKALPPEEVRRLQNSIGFHLCTSEAEGFGHYIMEAMSCRAVVLGTDGPPMNELVRPDRGLLIGCLDEHPPMRFSHRYLFDPASLEECVEEACRLAPAERERLGATARAFYLENDSFFRRRLIEVLEDI
jgi:hypothetical protein